jgi:murein DD-endopeptidase MepM/ murein hydrolase activator NlpD
MDTVPRVVAVVLLLVGCASSGGPDRGARVPSGWPVERSLATVSSGYGARRGGGFHQGIDLVAPRGTPVTATADGVVVGAGREKRYGKVVMIDHADGWQTRYAHLKRIKVKEGTRVRRGDVVGSVGRSGNASGDHLHYEVRRHGTPVDPRPTLTH